MRTFCLLSGGCRLGWLSSARCSAARVPVPIATRASLSPAPLPRRDLKTRIGAVRSTARGLDRALNDVLEGEGGGVLGVVQRSIAACKDAPAPTSEQARDRNRDAAALLIECHLLSLRNATKKLDAANGSLGGGEKFATILLDQNRNAIMKFDVVITAVTAFFAFGAMFTAIFGMNTPAHLFDPGGDPDKHSAVYGTAPRWAFPLVASLIRASSLALFPN